MLDPCVIDVLLQIKKSAENLCAFNVFLPVNPSQLRIVSSVPWPKSTVDSTLFTSWK